MCLFIHLYKVCTFTVVFFYVVLADKHKNEDQITK